MKKNQYRLNKKLIILAIALAIVIILFAKKSSSVSNPVIVDAAETGVMLEQKKVPYTESEVEMLAKTVYGEALVTNSKTEMSAVIWCILNRVDATGYACGNSIEYVVTYPGQFSGYKNSNPVTPEIDALVRDVLERWDNEKNGAENVGRTLPPDYIYFVGDGFSNYFSKEWKSRDYWDWSLASPYES